MDDAEFEANVARIIKDEICRGEGSNFLLSRKAHIQLADFDWKVANAIFRRLADNEFGAYMTFCFHDGERFFVRIDGDIYRSTSALYSSTQVNVEDAREHPAGVDAGAAVRRCVGGGDRGCGGGHQASSLQTDWLVC